MNDDATPTYGNEKNNNTEETVILNVQAARRLLERDSGDAALLYLAMLARPESSQSPADALRWERKRLNAAERVLKDLELTNEPMETPRSYTQAEIIARLEDQGGFRRLLAEVEHRMGRRLATPDLSILLNIYDNSGLPPDVIYLLVAHCMERASSRFGAGRMPTLKQIEKEGYAWARMGVDTQAAATDYIKRRASRNQRYSEYMRTLGLGDRPPAAPEEKYLSAWREWGFPAEAVAIAYDKTILKCHELNWKYCNGILKRWHQDGLHTAAEIERGDHPANSKKSRARVSSGHSFEDMVREFHEEMSGY